MKKSELNQNIHLSEGNIKSQNTDDVIFLTWSLPCNRGDERILFQAYTKSILFVIDWFSAEFGEDYEWNEETVCDLSKINIHLVYSIWHDTDTTDIQIAQELKLQTFTALPKTEISKAVENGAFLCNGDCGNCKECYTGESLEIVIPYH